MAIDAVSSQSSFETWQRARAALREAERRGADYADILRLSAEVILARNELTVDRLQAGWHPPDDVLKHLVVDEQLLRETDDATGP